MNKKVIDILKKHWLLLTMSGVALILLGLFAWKSSFTRQLLTPIARIEAKDTLTVEEASSRLDAYLAEEKRLKAEKYARPEEPIAVNFSGALHQGDAQKKRADMAPEKPGPAQRETSGLERKGYLREIGKADFKKPAGQRMKKQTKAAEPAERAEPKESVDKGHFYTIKAPQSSQSDSASPASFCQAVIHGDQKVKNNSTVRLRLKETLFFQGIELPKNTVLSGRINASGNGRIGISITSLGSIPVSLAVHDADYQKGIAYLTREPVEEAVREGKHEAVNEMLGSIPYGSIASGLARLGKNVTQKFRRQQSFFLVDGYPVLIALKP
jgi:hypothetical protein